MIKSVYVSKEKIISYIFLCIIGLIAIIIFDKTLYGRQLICRMMISACMAAGLDIFVGIGQLSLGHAVFMALGAYSCTIMTIKIGGNFGILVGVLSGILVSIIFSLVIGFAILKLRGDYLAVSSIGIGEIVRVVLENTDSLGGAAGLYGMTKFVTPINSYILFIACMLICIIFNSSKIGFLARTVGQDEEAAASIGVNTHKTKIIAFIVSGIITAIAGGFYSGIFGFISPGDFAYAKSTDILLAVIIGGEGTITGPMLAAMLIEAFFAIFRYSAVLRMIIYALILIIITLMRNYQKGGKNSALLQKLKQIIWRSNSRKQC
jgi:branched-chain amino acid transport system permease protein